MVLLGQSLGVVPEFISSIVLILIFGVWLRWLPMSADWPEGAGPLTQLRYLILPSLPLVLVFFGYIARVARVGTIEALDADYTRTAILKGLSMPTVMRRHVLRNALLPTITVAASLVGYLAGGLVVIETLFHYRGIGALIYSAARAKDFPMLEAGVLTRRRDLCARLGARGSPERGAQSAHARGACMSEALVHEPRRGGEPRPRTLAGRPAIAYFDRRPRDLVVLDLVRAVRSQARAARSVCRQSARDARSAVLRPLVRHRPTGPRRVLPRHHRRPRHLGRGAARDAPRDGTRHRARLVHRLFARASR